MFLEAVGKEVVAAIEPLHQGGHSARLTPHERPHVVAKPAIPLEPPNAGKPATQLIGGDIPRLRHEPHVVQPREQAELRHQGGFMDVHRAVSGA